MQSSVKRVLTLVLGWALVLLGIAGLVLPFLQGVIFLFAGLYLLSRESKTARYWLDRLKSRYPGVDRRLREIRWRTRKYLRRNR